jgi:hypothetical protein
MLGSVTWGLCVEVGFDLEHDLYLLAERQAAAGDGAVIADAEVGAVPIVTLQMSSQVGILTPFRLEDFWRIERSGTAPEPQLPACNGSAPGPLVRGCPVIAGLEASRSSAWQCGGQGFESPQLHHYI